MSSREIWTYEDLKLLHKLDKKGFDPAEIAEKIGRPIDSVLSKLNHKVEHETLLNSIHPYINHDKVDYAQTNIMPSNDYCPCCSRKLTKLSKQNAESFFENRKWLNLKGTGYLIFGEADKQ